MMPRSAAADLTITQARTKARAILADAGCAALIRRSPSAQKADRLAQVQDDTFRAHPHSLHPGILPQAQAAVRGLWSSVTLTRDLSSWDDRPVTSITKRDIIAAGRAQGTHGRPHRGQSVAGLHLEADAVVPQRKTSCKPLPVLGIERPGVETARERTLTEAEIAKLWPAWPAARLALRRDVSNFVGDWPSGGIRLPRCAGASIRPKPQPESMVEGCPFTPIILGLGNWICF